MKGFLIRIQQVPEFQVVFVDVVLAALMST
jgi:hypothetical protein